MKKNNLMLKKMSVAKFPSLGSVCVTLVLIFGFSVCASASDELKNQVEPVEYLINFNVTGNLADSTTDEGVPYYAMSGPGYAPKEIFSSGEVSDEVEVDSPIASLQDAQIVFSGSPYDPIVNFTCLPGSCKIKMKDGAVLESNAGVELQGRAINMWGPVIMSPDFNPQAGIIPIRIMGCGGLKEVAGKGRVANMVGSICFNGVLNFNQMNLTTLTGASKCSLTLHTPMPMPSVQNQ